ncbi:MAG: phage portal protein, partial [Clostridium sp.]
RDLLLEKEKGSFYFAHDTKELVKGDIEKRFKAYEIGIKNKILTVNEARYEENKAPIEAFNDTVVLGLNDVLYNTKKGSIYTPNTDKTTSLETVKGGEEN